LFGLLALEAACCGGGGGGGGGGRDGGAGAGAAPQEGMTPEAAVEALSSLTPPSEQGAGEDS
jgi:hypothetical protein